MDFKHTSIKQSALGWVKKSIDENLATIRSDLNIYIEEKDATLLQGVQSKLSDIQGVLTMIEQYGAAMLTEEMISLCGFIAARQDPDEQALEVLLRAVLQLPDYLEHIQAGQKDIPIAILPLLNDIRAVKNEDLFSEKLLFLPDLSMHMDDSEIDSVTDGRNQASMQLARKLRLPYQFSLLGVIRDKDVHDNLRRLGKITEVMEDRSSSEQVARLWWIVGALIESIARDDLPLGVSVKMLMGKVDQIFRRMMVKGERELLREQPIDLIKNLLYYIAQPECDGPKSQAIKTAYRLEQFLPTDKDQGASIAGPNQELLKTVSDAVQADLEEVKSSLEVYVNGDLAQTEQLKNLPAELHIISDTLAMIGLGSQRQIIEGQIKVINDVIEGRVQPDQEKMLAMAAELIQVDQALELMQKGQLLQEGDEGASSRASLNFEMGNMLNAVVTAALDDVQKIKTAILDFIKDSSKTDNIDVCESLLSETRGALALLNQDRAVGVVEGLIRYLGGHETNEFLEAEHLDQMSQVVVSIEYFLEALGEQRTDAETILDFADDQLEQLLAGRGIDVSVSGQTESETQDLVIMAESEHGAEGEPVEQPDDSDVAKIEIEAEQVEVEQASGDELEVESLSEGPGEDEIEDVVIEGFAADDNAGLEQDDLQALDASPVFDSEPQASAELSASGDVFESDISGESDIDDHDEDRVEFDLGQMTEDQSVQAEPSWHDVEALEVAGLEEVDQALVEPLAELEDEQLSSDVSPLEAQPADDAENQVDESEFEALQFEESPVEAPQFDEPQFEEIIADDNLESVDLIEDSQILRAVTVDEAEHVDDSDDHTVYTLDDEAHVAAVDSEPGIPVEPVEDDAIVLKPGSDPDILEIYLEEAEEESEQIRLQQMDWKLHPEDENALKNIRRSFHTIKGSGRLVGAMKIGEFAWDFENLLNRVIDRTIEPSEQIINAVGLSAEALPQLVDELKTGNRATANVGYLRGLARALASGQHVNMTQGQESTAQGERESDSVKQSSSGDDDTSEESEPSGSDLTESSISQPESFEQIAEDESDSEPSLQSNDGQNEEVLALPAEHEDEVLGEDGEDIHVAQVDSDFQPDAEQGSQDLPPEQTSEEPALDPFDLSAMSDMPGGEAGANLPVAEVDQDEGAERPQAPAQAPEEELMLDPELLVIYQQEVESHLNTVNSALENSDAVHELVPSEAMYRAIHTINGASRTADITSIGTLATLLEAPLKKILEQGVGLDEEVLQLYRRGHDEIKRMANELVEHRRMPELADDLRRDLESLLEEMDNHTVELPEQNNQSSNQFLDTLTMMNEEPGPDYDDELVEIFIEEATDLLEMSDHTLETWVNQSDDDDEKQGFGLVTELQRYLHTLKGGAKMAEFQEISDLSHELESLFIAIIDRRIDVNEDLITALHDSFDLLSRQVEQVKQRESMDSSDEQIGILKRLRKGESLAEILGQDVVDESATEQSAPMSTADLPQGVEQERRHDELHHRRQTDAPADDSRSSERDVVKVRSDLLDNLVNSAGEVSIYRARMEQQVSSFGSHLGELGQTIQRLKNQLRSLEAETDAQIHYSHRQDEKTSKAFDPLEMDRYTQIQELSKSLSESVDDLSSLQGLLNEQVKDSETLLLQQSRINTDLQDGLIRSRMVRFSGVVSRLRRLVRQTCAELAKKAELEVRGENNEIDVKVLDRMIAPLEHIIRNAISHGIESPVERIEKGKPETGKIVIDVSRDGSDVIVKISDDGAGVNVEKVRKRAMQQGIFEEGEELEDSDLIQLILKPGFSTAEQVSQVAGRGVGMDVVDSSIKELGGALQISTSPTGSQFTARLPFTLSINQAILVRAGDESYALPLINIEGITRIESDQMSEFYAMERPMMDYAGQQYALHYLSSLLDISHEFHVASPMRKVPVILLRSGDLRIALHIDEIIGNREIVVKPLGRLLGQAKGLAGASILADGLVVLILDINGLLRHGSTTQVVVDETDPDAEKSSNAKIVMVVDDSITMRRVATKLLVRNHYEVVTAKDGVDALAQLADHHPDVMLLDIEMPRMDGFELASHMKNDPQLRDIPIIMITSRTGTKHRDHAMSIGVEEYMGKPYQEEELVEKIGSLVG